MISDETLLAGNLEVREHSDSSGEGNIPLFVLGSCVSTS